jgi:hypothetical protein
MNSKGIVCEATQSGDSYSGCDIENNVILRTNVNNPDNGAIYFEGLDDGASTNTTVKNNFIRDYGSSANFTKGIYFDDFSSNITVTGNVIAGTGEFALQYHAGYNNRVSGNIIDLGSAGNQWVAFYQNDTPPVAINNMAGNTFTGNIVVNSGSTVKPAWDVNISGQALPTVANNVYHNYSGGTTSGGGITDTNPVPEDPQLSGWTYTNAAGLSHPLIF